MKRLFALLICPVFVSHAGAQDSKAPANSVIQASPSQDSAPQDTHPQDMLKDFQDFEMQSAVSSNAQFFSQPIKGDSLVTTPQTGPSLDLAGQSNVIMFDPDPVNDTAVEDAPLSYQELQALKKTFRIKEPTQNKTDKAIDFALTVADDRDPKNRDYPR